MERQGQKADTSEQKGSFYVLFGFSRSSSLEPFKINRNGLFSITERCTVFLWSLSLLARLGRNSETVRLKGPCSSPQKRMSYRKNIRNEVNILNSVKLLLDAAAASQSLQGCALLSTINFFDERSQVTSFVSSAPRNPILANHAYLHSSNSLANPVSSIPQNRTQSSWCGSQEARSSVLLAPVAFKKEAEFACCEYAGKASGAGRTTVGLLLTRTWAGRL